MSKSDEEYIEGMLYAASVASRQGDHESAKHYHDRATARMREARRGGD